MDIHLLEHVNIHSSQTELLSAWYMRVLGLKPGYRPPFSSNGAWLYAGDVPMVHLLEVADQPHARTTQIEHFAFRATGLESFLKRLEENNTAYTTVRVPELRIYQIHLSDPEGNHMHIDFPPEEADELGL